MVGNAVTFIDPFKDPMDAPQHSSLAEEDYRPGHGLPGGNHVDREPAEPRVDDDRFGYPVAPVTRAGRSQRP